MNYNRYFNSDVVKTKHTSLDEIYIFELLDNKDDESLQILLENYYYVLLKLANSWKSKTKHVQYEDDIFQDCILAFCNSYYKYDLGSNMHFVSYFKQSIYGYLQQTCSTHYRTVAIPKSAFNKIKDWAPEDKEKAFIKPYTGDPELPLEIQEDMSIEDPNRNLEKQEFAASLRKHLKPVEYDTLCMYYGIDRYKDLPYKQEEIAKKYGVSKSAISKRLTNIKAKLAKVL